MGIGLEKPLMIFERMTSLAAQGNVLMMFSQMI
jgi:hypothetical protein